MRLPLLVIIVFILNSCKLSIGTNGHKGIKTEGLSHYKPYSEASNFVKNDTGNILVYEINSKVFKEKISKSKYTWIHLWRPYCGAEACENINLPQKIAEKNGITFFLTATSYDYKSIKEAVERTNYAKPIYILQNSYYLNANKNGGKERSLKQLDKEINNNSKLKNRYADDYFFKDTLLIYIGSPVNKTLLDERKVDSLMKVYK